MEFFIEQIHRLQDIVTCLELYEDVSDMELGFQNKIIEKLEYIMEDIKIFNINSAMISKEDLMEKNKGLYILEVSLDIIDMSHLIIRAIEDNNTFIVRESCNFLKELFKEFIQ